MKISVKDASRFEAQIDNEIYFQTQRLRRVCSDTCPTVAAATEKGVEAAQATLARVDELQGAKFDLRACKSDFNTKTGVNERTWKIAVLTARKDFIENSILALPSVSSNTSYNSTAVTYSAGLSDGLEDCMRAEVKALSREIARLKDSCAGTNAQGTITISEKTADTLRKYGFIG